MKVVARHAVTIGVRTDTTGSGSHTQDLVMNLLKAMARVCGPQLIGVVDDPRVGPFSVALSPLVAEALLSGERRRVGRGKP